MTGDAGRRSTAMKGTSGLLLALVVAGLATISTPFAGEVAASADRIRPLLVGAEVPEVTLTAADGKAVDLRAAAKEQRSIFVFYRGGW
jgi:hypothetical protein